MFLCLVNYNNYEISLQAHPPTTMLYISQTKRNIQNTNIILHIMVLSCYYHYENIQDT